MNLKFIIEFESDPPEYITPGQIRYTSSKNHQTSTLTLTFFNLSFLKDSIFIYGKKKLMKSVYFFVENQKFSTKNIRIVWLRGKPFFLEVIFLITLESESIKLKKFFDNLTK